MALVEPHDGGIPAIPPVYNFTKNRRRWKHVKPCGTAAAYRRHLRRMRNEGVPAKERYKQIDDACLAWHRDNL
jgi:hypothetical protein